MGRPQRRPFHGWLRTAAKRESNHNHHHWLIIGNQIKGVKSGSSNQVKAMRAGIRELWQHTDWTERAVSEISTRDLEVASLWNC